MIKQMFGKLRRRWDARNTEVSEKGRCLIDYCLKIVNNENEYIEAYEEALQSMLDIYIKDGILDPSSSLQDEEGTRVIIALKTIIFFIDFLNKEERKQIVNRINEPLFRGVVNRYV